MFIFKENLSQSLTDAPVLLETQVPSIMVGGNQKLYKPEVKLTRVSSLSNLSEGRKIKQQKW